MLVDYTNGAAPIVQKRIDQYYDLKKSGADYGLMEAIFNSIPKNFRKIYMYEPGFEDALDKCASLETMKHKMLSCLRYCVEVIG